MQCISKNLTIIGSGVLENPSSANSSVGSAYSFDLRVLYLSFYWNFSLVSSTDHRTTSFNVDLVSIPLCLSLAIWFFLNGGRQHTLVYLSFLNIRFAHWSLTLINHTDSLNHSKSNRSMRNMLFTFCVAIHWVFTGQNRNQSFPHIQVLNQIFMSHPKNFPSHRAESLTKKSAFTVSDRSHSHIVHTKDTFTSFYSIVLALNIDKPPLFNE